MGAVQYLQDVFQDYLKQLLAFDFFFLKNKNFFFLHCKAVFGVFETAALAIF